LTPAEEILVGGPATASGSRIGLRVRVLDAGGVRDLRHRFHCHVLSADVAVAVSRGAPIAACTGDPREPSRVALRAR